MAVLIKVGKSIDSPGGGSFVQLSLKLGGVRTATAVRARIEVVGRGNLRLRNEQIHNVAKLFEDRPQLG